MKLKQSTKRGYCNWMNYIHVKIMLFLLLVNSFNSLIAQENKDKLLTPDEMKADVDFYFETLHSKHPNPYYYCSLEEFENKKTGIYAQLDKPLTKAQFLWILGEINSCLDAHSLIYFHYSLKDEVKLDDNQKLFPPVKFKDGKLFLADNTKDEITEINGIPIAGILSECQKTLNWKLPYKPNIDFIELWIVHLFQYQYNIRAPYKVKFNKIDNPRTIDGISLGELYEKNYRAATIRGSIENILNNNYKAHYYKIYPSHSIAIFYMNTFSSQHKNEFNNVLDSFINEVNAQKIKYIFYDVSKNQGGEQIGQYHALDVVKHDTVYYKLTEIRRNNNFNRKYDVNEILSNPNDHTMIPDNRQLFALQGNMTTSGADYFCRVIACNKLGVLVGQDTGEPTKAFSVATTHTMPNTGVVFRMATMFLDFSDNFNGETLKPDLYWDVHHNREFMEEELWDIINH